MEQKIREVLETIGMATQVEITELESLLNSHNNKEEMIDFSLWNGECYRTMFEQVIIPYVCSQGLEPWDAFSITLMKLNGLQFVENAGKSSVQYGCGDEEDTCRIILPTVVNSEEIRVLEDTFGEDALFGAWLWTGKHWDVAFNQVIVPYAQEHGFEAWDVFAIIHKKIMGRFLELKSMVM